MRTPSRAGNSVNAGRSKPAVKFGIVALMLTVLAGAGLGWLSLPAARAPRRQERGDFWGYADPIDPRRRAAAMSQQADAALQTLQKARERMSPAASAGTADTPTTQPALTTRPTATPQPAPTLNATGRTDREANIGIEIVRTRQRRR